MAFRFVLVVMLAIALASCSSMRRSKPAAAEPAASTAQMPAQAAPPAAPQSSSYTRSSSYMQAPGAYAARPVPPMEGNRRINEQDCTKAIDLTAGNLRCR